jgi:hypothetical protein
MRNNSCNVSQFVAWSSMAFRADVQSVLGRNRAIEYLITRNIPHEQRPKSQRVLENLIHKFGPVVDSYPSWHPLMTANKLPKEWGRDSQTTPSQKNGYKGLDHSIYLRNAIITCPYAGEETILASVAALKGHPDATITAEPLDAMLYMPNAHPVVIMCQWHRDLDHDGTIPKRIASGLLLEEMAPCWRWAEVAESWENMRHYILGSPRGSKSSLFVNQETGNALKNLYTSMINSGIHGPIYEERFK